MTSVVTEGKALLSGNYCVDLGLQPYTITTTTHLKVTYEQYQQKGYHLGCCKIQRNPKNKHKKEAKKGRLYQVSCKYMGDI
jgi:hypothetical protein